MNETTLDKLNDTDSILKYMEQQRTLLQEDISHRDVVRESLYNLKREKLELENSDRMATSNINRRKLEIEKAKDKYWQVKA